MISVSGCAKNTILTNSYCDIHRAEWVCGEEEAAVYDCLCDEYKIDKECEKWR